MRSSSAGPPRLPPWSESSHPGRRRPTPCPIPLLPPALQPLMPLTVPRKGLPPNPVALTVPPLPAWEGDDVSSAPPPPAPRRSCSFAAAAGTVQVKLRQCARPQASCTLAGASSYQSVERSAVARNVALFSCDESKANLKQNSMVGRGNAPAMAEGASGDRNVRPWRCLAWNSMRGPVSPVGETPSQPTERLCLSF